jgi:DNA-binding response OmpR family regulator
MPHPPHFASQGNFAILEAWNGIEIGDDPAQLPDLVILDLMMPRWTGLP